MEHTEHCLRRIYISEIVSNIGSRMTAAAIAYLLYRETGRGADQGIYYMMLTLPGIIFANPFGRVADRFSRKSLLVYADATRAVVMILMALAVVRCGLATILALLFLSQVLRCLYDTSVLPLASDLTSEEGALAKATANLRMIFHASFILGFSVGGFISYHVKPQYVFLIDAATFIFSAIMIRSLPIRDSVPSGYFLVLKEMFSLKYYLGWFNLVRDGFSMAWQHGYSKLTILMTLLREIGYGFFNPLQSWWPQVVFSGVKNAMGLSVGAIGLGCVTGGVFANKYLSRTFSAGKIFFSTCAMLVAVEIVFAGWAYSSHSFAIYCAGSLASAGAMSAMETGIFVRYLSAAAPGEKGAMTGFYQFITRLAIFFGSICYTLIVDRTAMLLLPFLGLALLAAAAILMIVRKGDFVRV